MKQDLAFQKYTVVTGNFGSGKTEIALNIAMHSAKQGKETMLVDMDLINPYFRSSTKHANLEEAGVEVICPGNANTLTEVTALPAEINRPFDAPPEHAVFDVGGDKVGATVLGILGDKFAAHRDETDFLFVVNIGRPLQNSEEAILGIMNDVMGGGSFRVTGLINNSNLARDTDMEMILEGDAVVAELARKTGIPVFCTVIREDLVHAYTGENPVMPIRLQMRPEWLDFGY